MRSGAALVAFVGVCVGGAALVDLVEGDAAVWAAEVGLLLGAAVAGYLIKRWIALALCLVPVLAAVPFGELSADRGDVFGFAAQVQIYVVPFFAIALAIGIALGRWRGRALAARGAVASHAGH